MNKYKSLKQILFSIAILSSCIATVSYSMNTEQRALMATKNLKEHCAFALIQQIHAACDGNRQRIVDCIVSEPYSTLDLSSVLAKYWCLLYGHSKKDFILRELDYGFSIEEFCIFNPFKARLSNEKGLDFSNCRINDLTGLKNIPGIANTEIIYLHENRLAKLELNKFDGLNMLVTLELHDNPLADLQPNTFKGLNNLTTLTLTVTQELKPEVFAGLDSLALLYFPREAFTEESLATFKADVKKFCPHIVVRAFSGKCW